MGNWRFGAFPKLPYSTMQQLNLDWILDRIRRFLPDTGTKGQVLTRTKDGAAWVDPEAASGAVSSVNGKTGAVVLTASDVGALPSSYQAPVTSVNGMTGDVVISGGGAVDSVNGKTGEVVLTAADVGALPSSYQAPVSSVNGHTGAVQLDIPDSTSDLTNDSGFVTAAQAAAAAPVQSVNGQTGAVSVPHYKRTLLWTNPTQGSLAAGTVNVDMTGYDNIEIECTETGNPPQRTYYVKCPIGTDTSAAQCTLTTFFFNRDLSGYAALGIMSRYANIYLHGINFGSGDMIYNGTYYKDWDNRAVPYRIWGIKYQEE